MARLLLLLWLLLHWGSWYCWSCRDLCCCWRLLLFRSLSLGRDLPRLGRRLLHLQLLLPLLLLLLLLLRLLALSLGHLRT